VEHRELVVVLGILAAVLALAGYWALIRHCYARSCEHGRPVFVQYECFCSERPK